MYSTKYEMARNNQHKVERYSPGSIQYNFGRRHHFPVFILTVPIIR